MFNPQMITAVNSSGKYRGMYNSLNMASSIQINAIFITKLKSPKVIILNGRVMAFNIGFTKKLRSPSIIPKSNTICQLAVKGKPKKLESGSMVIITPGTNIEASQSPTVADTN